MVYDCFPFFNELDILKIRFSLLQNVVDYFVLVEAKQTHSLYQKPLYFDCNKNDFVHYNHKIIHIIVDSFPDIKGYWSAEKFQRNIIKENLKHCSDDDIIIVSDVDEIFSPEILKNKINGIFHIEMPLYYFNLNYKSNEMWSQSFLGKWKDLKSENFSEIRCNPNYPTLKTEALCFHLSFLYGNDFNAYLYKLQSYAHQEYNKPEFCNIDFIQYCSKYGKDLFKRKSVRLSYKRNNYLLNNHLIPSEIIKKYYLKRTLFWFIPTIQNITVFLRLKINSQYNEITYFNPIFNSLKFILKHKILKHDI